MMLWWKYQQLRSSNLNTRLATIAELAGSKDGDSVGPLLFALKDANKEIRSAAALALGQFQDKQVVGPLIKMLADPATWKKWGDAGRQKDGEWAQLPE